MAPPASVVQYYSDAITTELRKLFWAKAEGKPHDKYDASIRALDKRRLSSLVKLVLSKNPESRPTIPPSRQLGIPIPGSPKGIVTGFATPIVAWHAYKLDPINGQFMGMARGAGPNPLRVQSNQSLAGSSNWSSFYPYPGDYDTSEEWIINGATSAREAAEWVADELINHAKYSLANPYPNYETYRLGISYQESEGKNVIKSFNIQVLAGADQDITVKEQIIEALSKLNGGRVTFNSYAVLNNGRLTHMQKVLGIDALKGSGNSNEPFFRSSIPFAELLDSDPQAVSLGDSLFQSQQISGDYQEIFTIGKPLRIRPESLSDYALLMRKLALREVGLDEKGNPSAGSVRYLKAANRAFSYLRAIGNISAMSKLETVYKTDYLMMNQRQQMLDLIGDDALSSKYSSQRILTAAIAKQQIEQAASDITSLATSKDLSTDNQAKAAALPDLLRTVASGLRGSGLDPTDLTKPLAPDETLGATLEEHANVLGNLLDDAVSNYVKPIVLNQVLLPFVRKSKPVNGVVESKRGVDFLTGTEKKTDIFSFAIQPEFGTNADKIINFSIEDKDTLRISKSAFGLNAGTFSVAVGAEQLNQLLETDIEVIYYKDKGELIRNTNGTNPGVGDQGGVFALFLLENPSLDQPMVTFA